MKKLLIGILLLSSCASFAEGFLNLKKNQARDLECRSFDRSILLRSGLWGYNLEGINKLK